MPNENPENSQWTFTVKAEGPIVHVVQGTDQMVPLVPLIQVMLDGWSKEQAILIAEWIVKEHNADIGKKSPTSL